jgi:NAD(P)-dependent dehydrogenase (short-subunit alcohol dehydrogenase family)
MQEFTNKVAIVTGGSSGIGLAIAKGLSHQGAKVVIFGRDQKKLQNAASSINALAVQGDVSKITDLDTLYHETQKKLGGIDILVVNAGIAQMRHIKEVDEEFFDEIVRINYKGLFFSVQRAIPFLNRGASVILISSAAAHVGWPAHSVYSATKAAVSHLARCMSADLIESGIRVNAISPGFVDTPLLDDLKANEEVTRQIKSKIPLRRFGTPEEIANTALFLASSKSAYMVGADLVIDGGISEVFPY